MTDSTWNQLDTDSAADLSAARLALHWAAQVPAAAGTTLISPRSDYSHTALTWDRSARALVTEPLPGGRRAGLRIHDFSLVCLDDDGRVSAEMSLDGRTLADSLGWLGSKVGGHALDRPTHDLPAHAVEDGGSFQKPMTSALSELDSWFANADRALSSLDAAEGEAAAVRCWPHHFDIATLLNLEEEGRSINVGMSPGDQSYDEPYFYVTPWPTPRDVLLPNLAHGGVWQRDGWVGAVLKGRDLGGRDQERHVGEFLVHAIGVSSRLLSIAAEETS